MNKTINIQKNLIIFGIPLLIIGIMVFITKSNIFSTNPSTLSIGITFDLLLTVPLVYLLLIRKTNIPKTTVVPFLIVGIIICSLILPTENHYYLNLFKTWVLPIVELSILFFVIFNIRKAIKRYKLNKTESFDFFTTLKSTCYEILPKGAVIPIVTEIAVFYYGFVHWKKRKLKDNEFTYHKDSGTVPLLIAIILIITIETITLHILLAKWNTAVAWILTFFSIYSGIQIFGFLKSMLKRPISIENNKLFLRYGIMNETTIDLADIDSIKISSKDIELNTETRKLSFLGELESHNIIIKLKEENVLIGLYGIKRTYKNLALHVDNKIEFKNRINNALQQWL
ncbi:hypothetical protein P8625_00970 [Tenacibaculum tangerinum]|uniref:Beta-carotene 15,15'-monooxygenase n=1 Tax=Tenacibaculum tangerinum TaxID=3038772 RepID=A0ABY8L6E2_9FLAO|nr:hypothetical protein [Tenacibaculum tangerinum]WGH75765.1 hypothetical protein P8625_00970 [Tenacibaculum tangerinum]